MAITTEFETVRDKISLFQSRIQELESNLDKSKIETARLNGELTDAKKEIDTLIGQKKELLKEKDDFLMAIKQFKELGEKDKKKINAQEKNIEDLEKNIEVCKKDINASLKEVNELKEELEKMKENETDV